MEKSIIKLIINSEADLPGVYRKASQLAELAGIETQSNHEFALAVSDVCRNLLKHIGTGKAEFLLANSSDECYLEALITDSLKKAGSNGSAVSGPKRNGKHVSAVTNHHSKVWLRTPIPTENLPLQSNTISKWRKKLATELPPGAEARFRTSNPKIMELLDYLRMLNTEVVTNVEETQNFIQSIEQAHQEVMQLLGNYEDEYFKLKLANQHLDTFAYSVSHDLKSPLRNLEGLINEFNKSVDTGEVDDIKNWLGMLQEQVGRMDEFIAGLLDSARSRFPAKEKKAVNPNQLLDQLVRTLDVPDGFVIDIKAGLPLVDASPVKLNQVFSNLICNAIKHHDKPKGLIRVSAQVLKRAGQVKFKVKDNGPGIPEGQQQAIFDAFKSGATTARDSTGLGLFIIRQIVEDNGGKLWVESNGRGSCFYFTWPLAQAAETMENTEKQNNWHNLPLPQHLTNHTHESV